MNIIDFMCEPLHIWYIIHFSLQGILVSSDNNGLNMTIIKNTYPYFLEPLISIIYIYIYLYIF